MCRVCYKAVAVTCTKPADGGNDKVKRTFRGQWQHPRSISLCEDSHGDRMTRSLTLFLDEEVTAVPLPPPAWYGHNGPANQQVFCHLSAISTQTFLYVMFHGCHITSTPRVLIICRPELGVNRPSTHTWLWRLLWQV